MSATVEIRVSGPGDLPALEALYTEAFPEEPLVPLVRSLLTEVPGARSLVAQRDGALAGHIVFVDCTIPGHEHRVALLGPLAVTPSRQRQGIGSHLAHAGLGREAARGTDLVFVLGDPAFYGRFGFTPGAPTAPPQPIPEEWRPAWQCKQIGSSPPPGGAVLTVPPPWDVPAYWLP